MTRFGFSVLGGMAVSGCALSPSIAVVGAYFPDWLFCIVGAVILTVAVYLLLGYLGAANRFGSPMLLYPTLVAFFALVGWLIFFRY